MAFRLKNRQIADLHIHLIEAGPGLRCADLASNNNPKEILYEIY